MLILLISILCAALLLFIYMWYEAHRNVVRVTELAIDELPHSFHDLKIVFISDIHRRTIHTKLIEELKQHNPDFIVLGGDIVEKGVPLSRVKENVTKLVKIAPCYFVWGNNDYEVDYRSLDVLLRDLRVNVLDNTTTILESSSDTLVLIGVDDITLERDNLHLALSNAPNHGFRILLSHNPDIIYQVKPEYRIKLVLSGHTHGGQIRIFGWGLREKGGLSYRNGLPLFISNGYGTTTIPLRLGAPSEVNLFILKASK